MTSNACFMNTLSLPHLYINMSLTLRITERSNVWDLFTHVALFHIALFTIMSLTLLIAGRNDIWDLFTHIALFITFIITKLALLLSHSKGS